MANTLVDEVVKYIQIANPYRVWKLSRLPVCCVGYGTGRLDLATNSKPLPGLIPKNLFVNCPRVSKMEYQNSGGVGYL
jgi:hypothetical protein